MSPTELEHRLQTLEREVADLRKLVKGQSKRDAMLKTFGTFANDPGFDEMMRLGREWREEANKIDAP